MLKLRLVYARGNGKLIDDRRMVDYWQFVHQGTSRPYLQHILDHSNMTRGHRIEDLEAKAAQGIPTIMETRTYPKVGGWEAIERASPLVHPHRKT